jgi:hypothetical protein
MPPLSGITKFLLALQTLPFWVSTALAIAGWVICLVLYVPSPFFDDFRDFRNAWGAWIVAGTIFFTVLAVARLVADRSARLRLFPGDRPQWWHRDKQPDGSYLTQIVLEIKVMNPISKPVQLMHARLVYPKVAADLVWRQLIHLAQPATDNVVPGHHLARGSVHIVVRKALAARAGGELPVVIKLTDHRGLKYRYKAVARPPGGM